ncbi:hypothetical protein FPV67DRAFT_1506802 [Lyophyllum atratum]|nr:hypothetical protein FPV67DRAFT_1506802 [Lyophyllum atratum]
MSVYPRSFPQEIIDKIIKTLDGPEMQETLVACCTVSSSFCNTAQKMLYRSISVSLGYPEDGARNEALESSLMSSSHLGTYVNSISILIKPSPGISFVALSKLNQLQSMKIKGDDLGITSWSFYPDIFKHNVYTVLRSATLRDFNLSNISHFPLSYLCASPCLQNLALSRSALLGDIVFDDTYSPRPPIDPKRKGCLRTLNLQQDTMYSSLHSALLSPLSPLQASGLRKLAQQIWDDVTVIGLKALLAVANSSLEELYIVTSICTFPVDFPTMHLQLGSLQNLRHVAFEMVYLSGLRYVANLCESLRNADHLDEVAFSVAGELCGLGDAADEAKSEWRRIDEYLIGGHGTSPLRLIRVAEPGVYQSPRITVGMQPVRHTITADQYFHMTARAGVPRRLDSTETLQAYFEDNMPHTYSAGSLCVERDFSGRALVDIFWDRKL